MLFTVSNINIDAIHIGSVYFNNQTTTTTHIMPIFTTLLETNVLCTVRIISHR